jgi:hypothetical protein
MLGRIRQLAGEERLVHTTGGVPFLVLNCEYDMAPILEKFSFGCTSDTDSFASRRWECNVKTEFQTSPARFQPGCFQGDLKQESFSKN